MLLEQALLIISMIAIVEAVILIYLIGSTNGYSRGRSEGYSRGQRDMKESFGSAIKTVLSSSKGRPDRSSRKESSPPTDNNSKS